MKLVVIEIGICEPNNLCTKYVYPFIPLSFFRGVIKLQTRQNDGDHEKRRHHNVKIKRVPIFLYYTSACHEVKNALVAHRLR
jgi:hypothetical protein